jgi:hypothetical protein
VKLLPAIVALSAVASLCFAACAASVAPNPSERCSAELRCSAGRVCDRGFCIAANAADSGTPDTCMRDETRCGARCVKLNSDTFNCGSCGNVCAGGNRCREGDCDD